MITLAKALEARSKKVNKVETVKASKDVMDVYAQLEAIATAGYEGLTKEDSSYFLKCFGLFDKGDYFMLRVRIPIGQLNNEQAIRIGVQCQTLVISLVTIAVLYLPIKMVSLDLMFIWVQG